MIGSWYVSQGSLEKERDEEGERAGGWGGREEGRKDIDLLQGIGSHNYSCKVQNLKCGQTGLERGGAEEIQMRATRELSVAPGGKSFCSTDEAQIQ